MHVIGRPRQIEPSICIDHRLAYVSAEARLLIRDLPMFCDPFGRIEFDAMKIGALVFPYHCRQLTIELIVSELTLEGLLTEYNVGDRTYLQVEGWNQNPFTDEPDSGIPAPPSRPAK
jgi:hypothetical protein